MTGCGWPDPGAIVLLGLLGEAGSPVNVGSLPGQRAAAGGRPQGRP